MRSQIWLGYGGSLFSYSQKIPAADTDASFSSNSLGSYHAEGRWFFSPKWGLLASYKSAPGQMKAGKVEGVKSKEFAWTISEIATQYRETSWLTDWRGLIVYPYFRASFQHHSMPRISIDSNSNSYIENLRFGVASLGVGANIFTCRHYFLEAYLNYKKPILSETGEVRSNGVNLDGAIGVGKAFGENWSLGGYWYGHYDEISYSRPQSRDPNPGNLNFLFSNFDFRMGYLF